MISVTPIFVQQMHEYLRYRGVPCQRLLITQHPMGGLTLDVDGVKREFDEMAIIGAHVPNDDALFEFFAIAFK